MKKYLRGMLWLIVVVMSATTAWPLTAISARKVYTAGQVFTAADYNADVDFWVTYINQVRAKFPGSSPNDSTKTTVGAHDSLFSATAGGVISLKSARAIQNFRADSLSVGSGPVVGFRMVATAGIRNRQNFVSADTVRIVDSLTVGVAAKATILAGATIQSIANFRADSTSVGSGPIVGFRVVATAGIRNRQNFISADTVRIVDSLTVGVAAKTTILAGATTRSIANFRADSLSVGSVPVVGYQLVSSGNTRAFFNHLRPDTLVIGSAPVVGYAMAVSGSNNALFGNNVVVSDIFYVNDNSNANMTAGATINQGPADNAAFELKSSDVAHGMTTVDGSIETDTYLSLRKWSGAVGGVYIQGLSSSTTGVGIAGWHVTDNTTKGTTATGAIDIRGGLKSGTTATDLGANANIAVIKNNGTARFIFDAEGTGHADDVWTDNAFDLAEDYDIFYVPAKDSTATRKSTYWSNKDTSWVAMTDTVMITSGVPAQVEEGTVLTVDTTHDNRLTPTTSAYQVIAGIVSYHTAQLGNAMGSIMEKYPQLALHKAENPQPVALVGIVPTKLTNDNGNIKRGDVVVAADRDGYAMKIGAVPVGLVLTSRHIVGLALMECDKAECFGNVQR